MVVKQSITDQSQVYDWYKRKNGVNLKWKDPYHVFLPAILKTDHW